jgi:uncharacterized protein YggE
MKIKLLIALAVFVSAALAQQVSQPPFVIASGEATITAQPDQARINIGVVTQAQTAQAAGSQNATQVQAVLAALNPIVGTNGDIKTIGYSVSPNYSYPQGQPAVLTGYTVTNTVQVTTSDLSSVGKLIDAATQAGANNIQSLQFSLKDDQPLRAQALRQAAAQAKTQADAIAAGLGLHTVRVISAEEGSASTILPVARSGAAAGTPTTPVQAGAVEVQATVTVKMEVQ